MRTTPPATRQPFRTLALAALLLVAALAPPPSFAQTASAPRVPSRSTDPQSFITQAGQSYYNLRSAGIAGFQCGIEPDWNAMLAEQRKIDPDATDETIRMFSTLDFRVTVDQDGRTVLDHDDIVTNNPNLAGLLGQLAAGMENATYGFFNTWVLFSLASPFPSPAAPGLKLAFTDSQYRLSFLD